MEKTSRFQYFKYTITLLFILLISVTLILNVHATEGDGPVIDIGGGDGVTGGGEYFDGGYGDWAGGYRTYLEDENGKIVQQVWDITFADPEQIGGQQLVRNIITALGGSYASTKRVIPYNEIQETVPGLQPPFLNYRPWGEQLNQWFESQQTVGGVTWLNAYWFINGVFGYKNSEDWKSYIEKFNAGEIRIVVEAIYYYRMVDYSRMSLTSASGKTLSFYGTVRGIQTYYKIENIAKKISETPYYGGGPWLGSFTNGDFATALQLVETDEFSGFVAPSAQTGNTSGEGGPYTYSDILASKQGWGMHVIYKEKAEEKWASWDATKYGGEVGDSPGKTPEMPKPDGSEATWREVTVVKYYTLIRSDGRVFCCLFVGKCCMAQGRSGGDGFVKK